MNGANLIIECLKAHHVDTIFGYPGGAIMPTYDAIYDYGLDHLLCRNEQGAAMAAIGYARASGKVGVCIATSGPGATNLITGLGDALMDSIPIVAITGQVASPLIGTDAFQEADVLGLSLACTKHSFIVQNINELPEIIAKAFEIAKSGRPGPVLIDVPKDVQVAATNAKPIVNSPPKTTALCDKQLTQALALLKHAKRPMAYIGGGVGMAGAVPALRYFLHTTQMPSVVTLKGLGAVSPDDPYYLGMIGMHGTKAANYATQEADLLLVFGARFDDRVTGKLDTFAPHAKVIHVDIDGAELGKLRRPDVALRGHLIATLESLSVLLDIAPWQETVAQYKQQFAFSYGEHGGEHNGEQLINPLWLLNSISRQKTPETIVVTDVGQHQMWSALHVQHHAPENFITSAGFGTMGFGLPAAIGAKKARPEDDVILVTGDGSIMMNIQELGSIGRGKAPIKIVLLDNQRLGMVRQWQSLFFNARHSSTILDDNPDFVVLASAFGIKGERIDSAHQVDAALERLFNSQEAYLLHICIHSDENVWPLVPPGACNADMLESME